MVVLTSMLQIETRNRSLNNITWISGIPWSGDFCPRSIFGHTHAQNCSKTFQLILWLPSSGKKTLWNDTILSESIFLSVMLWVLVNTVVVWPSMKENYRFVCFSVPAFFESQVQMSPCQCRPNHNCGSRSYLHSAGRHWGSNYIALTRRDFIVVLLLNW